MTRLLPFRADDGIFDPGFIEDRRKGLEAFVNKELVLRTYYSDHFESRNGCEEKTGIFIRSKSRLKIASKHVQNLLDSHFSTKKYLRRNLRSDLNK